MRWRSRIVPAVTDTFWRQPAHDQRKSSVSHASVLLQVGLVHRNLFAHLNSIR